MNKDVKRFLKNAFLLIVLFLIVMIPLNALYEDHINSKKITYRREIIYENLILETENPRLKYAFFGDSMIGDAINPSFIPNSFNFATGGEPYFKTYHKFKDKVENDNLEIDYVVLNINWNTMSDREFEQQRWTLDWDLYADFIPYSEVENLTDEGELNLLVKQHFPIIGNAKRAATLLVDPELSELVLGHHVNYKELDVNKIPNSLEESEYILLDYGNTQFSNVSRNYFRKSLQLAKEHNINVILITTPITRYEYDFITDSADERFNEYYEMVFSIVNEELGDNYTYLPYYNHFFDQDEYFADLHHLHKRGSEQFSKELAIDLEQLH